MATFPFDEEALRKLAEILEETGLSEVEVENEGHRMRVARSSPTVVQAAAPLAAAPASDEAPATAGQATASATGQVNSPMVGTVYLAPEPGADPFFKVGDQVNEGQSVLIIEAMKVMNALPAPHSGILREILVSDGQPVEFGEPLMIIN
jgi:acetyl-CoA carboxylase biotin carboxyl carrier protein